MFYNIRAVNEKDVPFIWDMLYEICYTRSIRKREEVPSRDVLKKPDLAKYVQNWDLGDTGFIAISTENQQPIGAAWYRLFKEDDRGYGYVDDQTPEIAIAVSSQYTTKGVGYSLINHLLQQAKIDGYQQISLSVDPYNSHALHLYQKIGFEKVGVIGASWVMKKVLS